MHLAHAGQYQLYHIGPGNDHGGRFESNNGSWEESSQTGQSTTSDILAEVLAFPGTPKDIELKKKDKGRIVYIRDKNLRLGTLGASLTFGKIKLS